MKNREIKFRAFNAENKEMIWLANSGLQYFDFEGSYSLGFTADGYRAFWAHEQYSEQTKIAGKFPIMQFVELTDVNGKDIYEGDLFSIDGVLHKVFFNTSTFSFDVHNFSSGEAEALYDFVAAGIEIEIIGNIYQNEDLLK